MPSNVSKLTPVVRSHILFFFHLGKMASVLETGNAFLLLWQLERFAKGTIVGCVIALDIIWKVYLQFCKKYALRIKILAYLNGPRCSELPRINSEVLTPKEGPASTKGCHNKYNNVVRGPLQNDGNGKWCILHLKCFCRAFSRASFSSCLFLHSVSFSAGKMAKARLG